MPMGSGLSAMVRCAASLELDLPSLETLSIGAPQNSLAGNFYELEIAGRWLCYTVSIVGSEHVLVSASLVDCVNPPELLLKARVTEPEWERFFTLSAHWNGPG